MIQEEDENHSLLHTNILPPGSQLYTAFAPRYHRTHGLDPGGILQAGGRGPTSRGWRSCPRSNRQGRPRPSLEGCSRQRLLSPFRLRTFLIKYDFLKYIAHV